MINKYNYDLDKDIANKIKARIKLINADIVTRFDLMRNYSTIDIY